MSISIRAIAMRSALLILLGAWLAGCATWSEPRRQGVTSSLVDYLYPNGEVPEAHAAEQVRLALPLTVGIGFVPTSDRDASLPEALKMSLLHEVRDAFADRPFVRRIEVLPDHYLRAGGGLQNLEQVGRLYGLDVIALVSYDQVAMMHERASSLLYLTIVGAYTVHGNSNEVSTFVDTAVLDVRTRRLLFRAPGFSQTQANTTLIRADADRRALQREGFSEAVADMIVRLDGELEGFRGRVREDQTIEVSGSAAAGAMTLPILLLLGGLALVGARRRVAGAPGHSAA